MDTEIQIQSIGRICKATTRRRYFYVVGMERMLKEGIKYSGRSYTLDSKLSTKTINSQSYRGILKGKTAIKLFKSYPN
ncbi:hypothetical protein MNBD_IGNAVI01-884 [hydrothermal vent metagenome]|uniref:Uncharacterized protein n=1 Tax=hydrothermal vent metagenome TaxID=652676 RepID=A0A3B1BVQ9_9ZZZZ